ncbi:MAG: o-succinylbenzoate synthase [Anaerolineae bacterium]|nr:o-succinylbenzoate synthase [Anaerolineae bacterium]
MIVKAHLWHVAIQLLTPFKISSGEVSSKDTIVVELEDEAGRVGWGESSPMAGPFYSPETPDSVWDELNEQLLPWLAQRAKDPLTDLLGELAALPTSGFARAGIDGALWDLRAQRARMPLYQALGCARRDVPSGFAVGLMPNVADLLAAIARYLPEGGYRRVKIKIEPGWDVEPLTAIRKCYGPGLILQTDANASYRREHIPVFKEMDRFHLAMHEQPMAKLDFDGLVELRQQVRTPICVDESAETLPRLRQVIDRGACDIVNIKIQRLGGLTPALAAIELCARHHIPNWMGTMPELGIASVHALHLAMHTNMRFPTDVQTSAHWFVDNIIDPPLSVCDGLAQMPELPGIGFEVNRPKIAQYLVREQTFNLPS